MASRTAFNPTRSPVVYDDEGRVVGGLAHVEVDETLDVVQAAISSGQLVWSPTTTSRKGGA